MVYATIGTKTMRVKMENLIKLQVDRKTNLVEQQNLLVYRRESRKVYNSALDVAVSLCYALQV